jgi:hypothetical protein
LLHLEHKFVRCWKLDTSGSRLEISVVLEEIEISWADRVRNEDGLQRVKEKRNILHTIQRRKANWIGHILRRYCVLRITLCWRRDRGKGRSGGKTRKKM